MTSKRLYAGYFVVQAVVGIALWISYGASTTVRSWFELTPATHAVTDSFVVADIGVIVVASLVSAWAIASEKNWAVPAAAFTAGAVVYPTVYLVGWVARANGVGAAGLAIMVPPATFTCWIAYQTWKSAR